MCTKKEKLADYYDPSYYNFDGICSKLEWGEHFTFSRFGDGEFSAILGLNGANCDSHQYFPDMGQELAAILRKSPIYGLSIFTTDIKISPDALRWLNKNVSADRKYSRSDVFHLEMKESSQKVTRFFKAINDRNFILVGPSHLRKMKTKFRILNHVEVPTVDCWEDTERILGRIEYIRPQGKTICFAASMAANVWIDRLFDKYGESCTLIDCGSVFDPFTGVNQRSFHRKAEWIKTSKYYCK